MSLVRDVEEVLYQGDNYILVNKICVKDIFEKYREESGSIVPNMYLTRYVSLFEVSGFHRYATKKPLKKVSNSHAYFLNFMSELH